MRSEACRGSRANDLWRELDRGELHDVAVDDARRAFHERDFLRVDAEDARPGRLIERRAVLSVELRLRGAVERGHAIGVGPAPGVALTRRVRLNVAGL